MATRVLPAREIGRLGAVIAEPKQQLGLGNMVTNEAARVLQAVKDQGKRNSSKSKPEETFDFECRTRGLPPYLRNHQFAKQAMGRGWKFDFCWIQYKLAVEIEGLVMRQLYEHPHAGAQRVWVVYGRHATIDGLTEDMRKYNAASRLGWALMRFDQRMVKDGTAITETMQELAARGWQP